MHHKVKEKVTSHMGLGTASRRRAAEWK